MWVAAAGSAAGNRHSLSYITTQSPQSSHTRRRATHPVPKAPQGGGGVICEASALPQQHVEGRQQRGIFGAAPTTATAPTGSATVAARSLVTKQPLAHDHRVCRQGRAA